MLRRILFVLRVDPDPGRGVDSGLLQDGELRECRDGGPRVSANGQAGFTMRDGSRADQLLFCVGERATVEAQLDETGTDARTFYAVFGFVNPALRESFDGI